MHMPPYLRLRHEFAPHNVAASPPDVSTSIYVIVM